MVGLVSFPFLFPSRLKTARCCRLSAGGRWIRIQTSGVPPCALLFFDSFCSTPVTPLVCGKSLYPLLIGPVLCQTDFRPGSQVWVLFLTLFRAPASLFSTLSPPFFPFGIVVGYRAYSIQIPPQKPAFWFNQKRVVPLPFPVW